ncbi:MAG TPA: TPM domain-containing protein [Caulobacterales bacterium]|nr:TPM domain-containing protein [Caulobacterales bacterium]
MTPSQTDLDAIEKAVTAAESKTTGEIAVVLASAVSDYREIPLAYAAGAALIAPPIALWLGADAAALMGGAWSVAHAAALDRNVALAISLYAAAQALTFTLVYLLVSLRAIRRALTPGFLKRERAHKAAMAQFLATGLDGSAERTGVVIFAALDDHVVEVVADRAIHEKVGASAWEDAVRAMQEGLKRGALGEGIARGVELCGAALAAHFPGGGDNPNRVTDAPRVI